MLRFIMEKNVLLYVLAAACAVGVVSQMILRRIYDGLLKNTRNTGAPEGRFLQQLRQRFQYCGHLNGQVGDIQALIQKSLLEYRVAGISLHGFWRLGFVCLTASLLCAFAGTMARLQGGAPIINGNVYFWLGAGAVVLTALAYGLADTGYQSQALEVCLRDYLENSGVTGARGEQEETSGLEFDAAAAEMPAVSIWGGRRTKRRAKAEASGRTRSSGEISDQMRSARELSDQGRFSGELSAQGRSSKELSAQARSSGEISDQARSSMELSDRVRAQGSEAAAGGAGQYSDTISEQTRAQRNGDTARSRREKNEIRENLSRMKTGMRESAASDADRSEARSERGSQLLREMDPKEQERLIREVLSEFLSQ
ncbi:MAG: hypothetical protein LUG93_16030 [Lachnospiraceae bacterium]|nr:hypothetical protein [Lachnospiraceae bacterium]